MNTELLQTLTLAIAANLRIAGKSAPRFAVGEGLFKFWESYRFVEETKGLFGSKVHVLAADPQAWLDQVAGAASAVRVFNIAVNDPGISDREASGFAGGGARWILEVQGAQGCDLWQPTIELGDRDRADQRIWRSQVWRVAQGQAQWGLDVEQPSAETASAELAAALEAVLAFAVNQGIDNFADIFREALAQLTSGGPTPGSLFEGLDLPDAPRRLLEAAGSAFVFGGMGSWNDMGFDGADAALYREVSDRLYEAIQAALPAAVNSTVRARAA